MEGLLRHRQLRLFEMITTAEHIPESKKQKILEWIAEGTIREHAELLRASRRGRRKG